MIEYICQLNRFIYHKGQATTSLSFTIDPDLYEISLLNIHTTLVMELMQQHQNCKACPAGLRRLALSMSRIGPYVIENIVVKRDLR